MFTYQTPTYQRLVGHEKRAYNYTLPVLTKFSLQRRWMRLYPDVFVCTWCSGTTVVMHYGNDDVYRIHLHPGRDHYWKEVLLRASATVRTTVVQ